MEKMKNEDKRTFNLMPHLMGHPPLLEKGVFGDNTIFLISYLTEIEALTRILPPCIQPANDPVITIMYRHSELVEFLGGGELNLLGVFVPSIFKGKRDNVSGSYWPVLWENNAMAVILGRELMGVAKLYGDISNPAYLNGIWRGVLSEEGHPLIEMKFRNPKRLEGDSLKEVQKIASNGAVIGWKHIPNENGLDAEISHATYYRSPSVIEKVWAGEGEVKFFETDPVVNFWTDHILKSLRALPLIKPLYSFMMKGSGEHLVGEGRALE